MRATLTDVARSAGVSTATASRVLNNKMVMRIPDATVQRVRDAARVLDYRPNQLARALLTGRTHAIGIHSLEMSDPHFGQLLDAVDRRAQDSGYHVVVSSSLNAVSGPGRADGLIVIGGRDRIPHALRPRVPVIHVNGESVAYPGFIGWSDAEGMHRAVRYLANLGHRHIAGLLCYGGEPPPGTPKVDGFLRAVEEAGVEARCYWQATDPFVLCQTNQFDNGYRAAQALIADWRECTGIVARNDFIALGAIRALHEAGRAVPGDFAVVGYTDSVLAACADPPLTSVRTPFADAGVLAFEALLQMIDEGAPEHAGVMLPTDMTVRASAAPPRIVAGGVRRRRPQTANGPV